MLQVVVHSVHTHIDTHNIEMLNSLYAVFLFLADATVQLLIYEIAVLLRILVTSLSSQTKSCLYVFMFTDS